LARFGYRPADTGIKEGNLPRSRLLQRVEQDTAKIVRRQVVRRAVFPCVKGAAILAAVTAEIVEIIVPKREGNTVDNLRRTADRGSPCSNGYCRRHRRPTREIPATSSPPASITAAEPNPDSSARQYLVDLNLLVCLIRTI
jgi:hypothetical protein